MPSQADIDAFGDLLAAYITAADATAPPMPETDDIEVISEYAVNVHRPYQMRKGLAKALAAALDPAWEAVESTNSSNPEAAKLGTGWFNKAPEWAAAAVRKIPLLGKAELDGYVYTAGSNALILTLPPRLLPDRNRLFATVIDFKPAYISVWIDGTVSVWFAEATTRQHVTLSGISWKVAA